MAVSRLCMKNLQQRLCTSAPTSGALGGLLNATKQSMESDLQWFSTAQDQTTEKPDEIAVSQGRDKSKLAHRRSGRPWKNRRGVLLPFGLRDLLLRSGFGDEMEQMTANLHRVLENFWPWQLFGRMKEDDKAYKLKLNVPGLTKDDLKITVEDRFLVIKGEHEEEDGDTSSDDEEGPSGMYGYCNAILLLPDDAKPDEIKAELKHGVLCITIPKSEEARAKNVKEVEIE